MKNMGLRLKPKTVVVKAAPKTTKIRRKATTVKTQIKSKAQPQATPPARSKARFGSKAKPAPVRKRPVRVARSKRSS